MFKFFTCNIIISLNFSHVKSLKPDKEAQLHAITELHKDDPKIEQFVTKALGLNS